MKCQKCGAEMTSGHFYCTICGAEYQIVPDFEPEIELSIAESMSGISETIEEPLPKETASLDFEQKKFKVPAFSTVFFFVLVFFVFIYTGYYKYTHTMEYRNAKALEAINNYDYYKAAGLFESLRKENPQDAYWYIQEASAKMQLNKPGEAYKLAVNAIEVEENTDLAYEFLLSYLAEQKNYIEMDQILKACDSHIIKEKYQEYLCESPKPNYASGNYSEILELAFESEVDGSIYYTLDGKIPDSSDLKYEVPITLGNGTHIFTFIYESTYGVFSEPQVFEYHVLCDTPLAPTVTLDSGSYSYAEKIEVTAEEGTKIYYTTDSTYPTLDSNEYTGPIPMPLGESTFNFVAYSSNGVASDVTYRKYNLDIKSYISIEDAEIILMQKLIDIGHILNFNGSIKDRYGIFHYFYKYTISETEQNYYVFEEHYLENQINNPLNHFYAVDVIYGTVYKMVPDGYGNFTRAQF